MVESVVLLTRGRLRRIKSRRWRNQLRHNLRTELEGVHVEMECGKRCVEAIHMEIEDIEVGFEATVDISKSPSKTSLVTFSVAWS